MSRLLPLALLLLALPASAGRPMSELQLLTMLNGQETLLGVLTSSGSSVTNATTATPFTLAAGSLLKVQCDAAAVHIGPGATASATLTSANYKERLVNAYDERFIILDGSTTSLAMIPASGSANCVVWRML